MEISGWKYYNHAAFPDTQPHENVNTAPILDKSIWKVGDGKALLARWTSDWDCSEKDNVNFALIMGIVDWFMPLIPKGCYLCDGARNVLHETEFQDFLIKYFGFRKAYCKLNIVYRPGMEQLVTLLFPFRKLIGRVNKLRMVSSVLKMEAWNRGLPG